MMIQNQKNSFQKHKTFHQFFEQFIRTKDSVPEFFAATQPLKKEFEYFKTNRLLPWAERIGKNNALITFDA
jgi:hypothetical protein